MMFAGTGTSCSSPRGNLRARQRWYQAVARAQEQALVAWFDQVVTRRLDSIDMKLDQLARERCQAALGAAGRPAGLPQGREAPKVPKAAAVQLFGLPPVLSDVWHSSLHDSVASVASVASVLEEREEREEGEEREEPEEPEAEEQAGRAGCKAGPGEDAFPDGPRADCQARAESRLTTAGEAPAHGSPGEGGGPACLLPEAATGSGADARSGAWWKSCSCSQLPSRAPSRAALSRQNTMRSRGPAPTLRTNRSVARTLSGALSTKIARKATPRDNLWTFLEVTESSRQARLYSKFMSYLILASVAVTLFQTLPSPLLPPPVSAALETVFDIVFALEVAVRLSVCPSCTRFLQNPYNIIDTVAAVAPFGVRASVGFVILPDQRESPACLFLNCGVPVLRLCKTLRRFQTFQLLLNVVSVASEALPVLMFVFLVIAMVFSSLLYFVEPRSNVECLPRALWLTIVTMTTVGYGDTVPVTVAGKTIVSVLVVVCLLYMSMPLGILGSEFTHTWNNRHRVLLIRRTRERLDQWGYDAGDLPKLFQHYDLDDDGELNLSDFKAMLQQMRIGLSEDSIVKLFQCFDCDGSGSIDEKEFVRAVFPQEFDEVYSSRESGDNTLPHLHSRFCDDQHWIDLAVPATGRSQSEILSHTSLALSQ